ncbi:VOC family protein [Rhizobium sp. 9140]|uniref:VOC family protein n=1 Tax=Rhizobium sp. 9140 TaxID=1761900 RepID=UPI000799CEB8|nr:VOC family protein [Rhizobium sp. 9140]CZT33196.1 Predicted lactoylglutathione lyase [Rhizobium sp. 9140]
MQPTYILLVVNDPLASAAFYESILGTTPVEAQKTFALFHMNPTTMLGLWSKHTIEPPVTVAPGSAELCFALESAEAVDACHETWKAQDLPILQTPVEADFGYTFTAADPDGHRLRTFCPSQRG